MKYHFKNNGWDRVQPEHIAALLEPYGSLEYCRGTVVSILSRLTIACEPLDNTCAGLLICLLGSATTETCTTVEFNGLADVTLITPTSKTRMRFTPGAIDIDFGAGGHTRCATLREKFQDFPGEFVDTPSYDEVWPTPPLPFEDGPPLEVLRKKRGTP